MWFFKRKAEMPKQVKVDLAELNFGENDILVLETEHVLSQQQRKLVADYLNHKINDKNNKVLVLDSGIKLKVIHRR